MKKNGYVIIGGIIGVILILGLITNYVDSGRVGTGHEPKYCLKLVNKEGSKVTYWGLGYKVIRYVGVSPNEPYKNNIGVKMGSWFMKYDLPIDNDEEKEIVINSLDDFYNTKLTKNDDIRALSDKYSIEDAKKDKCFVTGLNTYNLDLYNKFIDDYQNKKTAYIRIANTTTEGDIILHDILYHSSTNKLYLVVDSTRDKFSVSKDRTISLKEYKELIEYDGDWVLTNGEVTEESFDEGEAFIVTTINSEVKGE